MTRLVPIVIGAKPAVNLFRSIRHELPANENARLFIRWDAIVKACEVIKKRAAKEARKGLRLVKL